jgi:GH25 family lysozyme M1 (1,4-beta-N-acetylmuramidase)
VADLVQGVDVSRWQGAVNWSAVKAAGKQFTYVKVSDGASSSYATAAAQFHEATNAGLITGVYHYANPAYSAVANADAFASQVNALGAIDGHLPPCLDLEIGVGSLSNWAATFVAELRRLTGASRVMVYSGLSFFTHQITESWMDDDIFLWLARYGRNPGDVGYSSSRLVMHQYSQNGQVAGVAGNVDLDVALSPLDQLTGGDLMAGLTPDQDAKLTAAYQFITGSSDVVPPDEDWPGWPTWPGGTDEHLSATDYQRRTNVQLNALAAAVSELGNKTSALAKRTSAPPLQLTQADVNRIAAAVVSLQQAKAQQSPAEGV